MSFIRERSRMGLEREMLGTRKEEQISSGAEVTLASRCPQRHIFRPLGFLCDQNSRSSK